MSENFQGADVKIPVMKECLETWHLPCHKTPVLADTVTTHRRRPLLDKLREEIERLLLRFFSGRLAGQHALRQSRLAVLPGIPLIHRDHNGLILVKHQLRAYRYFLQATIGDNSCYLDYLIIRRVQTGHFKIDPNQVFLFIQSLVLRHLFRSDCADKYPSINLGVVYQRVMVHDFASTGILLTMSILVSHNPRK